MLRNARLELAFLFLYLQQLLVSFLRSVVVRSWVYDGYIALLSYIHELIHIILRRRYSH
jgi:hypothetical protein